MPEPDGQVTGVVLTASASATHPDNTVLDEDGNPLPTQEQD